MTVAHQFTITEPFRDIFPEVQLAVITVRGIDNHDNGQVPAHLLADANDQVEDLIPYEPISKNPLIHEWREAFSKFKTKKGARFAVENLLKRAKKGHPVRSINPIVDLYNTISLTYGFAVAALDEDKINGNMQLTVAKGGEPFVAIGESENDPALPGEVIYRDDVNVTSRCWAWRDSEVSEATEDSTNFLLYIECPKPEWQETHRKAVKELTDNIKIYLGGEIAVQLITKDKPTITIK